MFLSLHYTSEPEMSRTQMTQLCESCHGDGRVEYGHPNAPSAERVEKCTACDGTGELEADNGEIAKMDSSTP